MRIRFRAFASALLLALCGQSLISEQHQLAPISEPVKIPLPLGAHQGPFRWSGERLTGCDFCDSGPTLWSVDRQGKRTQFVSKSPMGAACGFTM